MKKREENVRVQEIGSRYVSILILCIRLTLDVFSEDFNGTEHDPYLFGYDFYSYETSERRC